MKVIVYAAREDEKCCFEEYNKKYNFVFTFCKESLTMANIDTAKGHEAIWIVTSCRITREITAALSERGVKYIVSRAAGTDHIDLEALREYGLKAANVPFYSPAAIAEHTVMLVMMLLRNMKREFVMVQNNDFSLNGLRGRELHNMKVGIFGTGRIGCKTIELLTGFGCKIYAYDVSLHEDLKDRICFTTKETLYKECDILIFHCPLTSENYHMINRDTLSQMKDGVLLVNTARGGLFQFTDILDALKSGKVGGLAFDVYEGEEKFLRRKLDAAPEDAVFNELAAREDVIFTSHISFYTDQAIANMISGAMDHLYEYQKTGRCTNDLV